MKIVRGLHLGLGCTFNFLSCIGVSIVLYLSLNDNSLLKAAACNGQVYDITCGNVH